MFTSSTASNYRSTCSTSVSRSSSTSPYLSTTTSLGSSNPSNSSNPSLRSSSDTKCNGESGTFKEENNAVNKGGNTVIFERLGKSLSSLSSSFSHVNLSLISSPPSEDEPLISSITSIENKLDRINLNKKLSGIPEVSSDSPVFKSGKVCNLNIKTQPKSFPPSLSTPPPLALSFDPNIISKKWVQRDLVVKKSNHTATPPSSPIKNQNPSSANSAAPQLLSFQRRSIHQLTNKTGLEDYSRQQRLNLGPHGISSLSPFVYQKRTPKIISFPAAISTDHSPSTSSSSSPSPISPYSVSNTTSDIITKDGKVPTTSKNPLTASSDPALSPLISQGYSASEALSAVAVAASDADDIRQYVKGSTVPVASPLPSISLDSLSPSRSPRPLCDFLKKTPLSFSHSSFNPKIPFPRFTHSLSTTHAPKTSLLPSSAITEASDPKEILYFGQKKSFLLSGSAIFPKSEANVAVLHGTSEKLTKESNVTGGATTTEAANPRSSYLSAKSSSSLSPSFVRETVSDVPGSDARWVLRKPPGPLFSVTSFPSSSSPSATSKTVSSSIIVNSSNSPTKSSKVTTSLINKITLSRNKESSSRKPLPLDKDKDVIFISPEEPFPEGLNNGNISTENKTNSTSSLTATFSSVAATTNSSGHFLNNSSKTTSSASLSDACNLVSQSNVQTQVNHQLHSQSFTTSLVIEPDEQKDIVRGEKKADNDKKQNNSLSTQKELQSQDKYKQKNELTDNKTVNKVTASSEANISLFLDMISSVSDNYDDKNKKTNNVNKSNDVKNKIGDSEDDTFLKERKNSTSLLDKNKYHVSNLSLFPCEVNEVPKNIPKNQNIINDGIVGVEKDLGIENENKINIKKAKVNEKPKDKKRPELVTNLSIEPRTESNFEKSNKENMTLESFKNNSTAKNTSKEVDLEVFNRDSLKSIDDLDISDDKIKHKKNIKKKSFRKNSFDISFSSLFISDKNADEKIDKNKSNNKKTETGHHHKEKVHKKKKNNITSVENDFKNSSINKDFDNNFLSKKKTVPQPPLFNTFLNRTSMSSSTNKVKSFLDQNGSFQDIKERKSSTSTVVSLYSGKNSRKNSFSFIGTQRPSSSSAGAKGKIKSNNNDNNSNGDFSVTVEDGYKCLNGYLLVLQEIAKTNCGSVLLACNLNNNEMKAVKFVNKTKAVEAAYKQRRFTLKEKISYSDKNNSFDGKDLKSLRDISEDDVVKDKLLKNKQSFSSKEVKGNKGRKTTLYPDSLVKSDLKTSIIIEEKENEEVKPKLENWKERKVSYNFEQVPDDNFWIGLHREVELLRRLDHPNVIKLDDVIENESDDKVYLVMPFCEKGPILTFDKANRCKRVSDIGLIRTYMKQILSAVSYIHSNLVAHCDIKPDNILLGNDSLIFLTDFGASKVFYKKLDGDFEGEDIKSGNGSQIISSKNRGSISNTKIADGKNMSGKKKNEKFVAFNECPEFTDNRVAGANEKLTNSVRNDRKNSFVLGGSEVFGTKDQTTVREDGGRSLSKSQIDLDGERSSIAEVISASFFTNSNEFTFSTGEESKQQHNKDKRLDYFVNSTQCTPAFTAPETISGKSFDPFCADIWSVGVTFYSLLYGELPYNKHLLRELYLSIQNEEVDLLKIYRRTWTDINNKKNNNNNTIEKGRFKNNNNSRNSFNYSSEIAKNNTKHHKNKKRGSEMTSFTSISSEVFDNINNNNRPCSSSKNGSAISLLRLNSANTKKKNNNIIKSNEDINKDELLSLLALEAASIEVFLTFSSNVKEDENVNKEEDDPTNYVRNVDINFLLNRKNCIILEMSNIISLSLSSPFSAVSSLSLSSSSFNSSPSPSSVSSITTNVIQTLPNEGKKSISTLNFPFDDNSKNIKDNSDTSAIIENMIKSHTEAIHLLLLLLNKNPSKRINANDALKHPFFATHDDK